MFQTLVLRARFLARLCDWCAQDDVKAACEPAISQSCAGKLRVKLNAVKRHFKDS
eukprot:m.131680 g.131680  ORF g.131680 m.131680 type:complete len:55 (+) comp38048_c0_seq7:214-378(+)